MAARASATTLHVVVWARGLPTGRGVEGVLCGGRGGLRGSLTVLMTREYDVGGCPAQLCDRREDGEAEARLQGKAQNQPTGLY